MQGPWNHSQRLQKLDGIFPMGAPVAISIQNLEEHDGGQQLKLSPVEGQWEEVFL